MSESMSQMLCEKCDFLLENWENIYQSQSLKQIQNNNWVIGDHERFKHHTISALESSANHGCQLCKLFFSQLDRQETSITDTTEMDIKISKDGRSFSLMGYFAPDGTARLVSVDLFVNPQRKTDIPEENNYPPLASSTGSTESLDILRTWLGDCLKSHTRCDDKKELDYPTRLLAIGKQSLHLLTTAKFRERPKYATLNHPHGETASLKLESSNLSSLLDTSHAISQDELCKTFQDSISIARHVGLDYIWINALCVIQNDPEDKARQSASMSDIYGNSTLNIVAASSAEGTAGCFFNRTTENIETTQLPIHLNSERSIFDFCPRDIPKPLLDSLSQGWAPTFQERFLAPRSVHFTATQLFWECRTRHACETFPRKMPTPIDMLITPRQNRTSLDPLDTWYNSLPLYTREKLAREEDRLVAIGGVARWVQSQTRDKYLAGMWRTNLEAQLCWRHWGNRKYSKEYVAPSWSWAKVSGQVTFEPRNVLKAAHAEAAFKLLAHVRSVSMVPKRESNPWGEITTGSLRLAFSTLIRVIAPDNLAGEAIDPVRREVVFETRHQIVADDLNWGEQERDVFYALPILESREENRVLTVGIVLEAMFERGEGVYRRAGYFELDGEMSELVYPEGCIVDSSAYGEIFEEGKIVKMVTLI